MLSRVGIVCFLASYLVVLGLEFVRFFASKIERDLRTPIFVATVLGAVAHCAFLYYNDWLQNDRLFASASGWFFVLAFGVVLAQLYFSLVYPKTQFGLFLLPLAIVLCCVGLGAGDVEFAPDATCRWVRATHGISLLFAATATFIGAIVGVMFFLQRSRLKRKIFVFGLTLPSLERLAKTTRFSANVALVFLGVGVASGYYLKIFAAGPDSQTVWRDPVALGATTLFFATLIRRFARSKSGLNDAADSAFLSIACFVVLAVLLLFVAFSDGHWQGSIGAKKGAKIVANPVANFDSSAFFRQNFGLPLATNRVCVDNIERRVPFVDASTLGCRRAENLSRRVSVVSADFWTKRRTRFFDFNVFFLSTRRYFSANVAANAFFNRATSFEESLR